MLCVPLAHAQEEQDALEKRQGQYNTMEKRNSELSKEVKLLQEALADFNTVLDKVGRRPSSWACWACLPGLPPGPAGPAGHA